jgi:hypothetical protein
VLSILLEAALDDLEQPSGVGPQGSQGSEGSQASADIKRLGQLALRAGRDSWDDGGHEHSGQRACRPLAAFIDVITFDQSRHRPKIPAGLAKAWVQAAQNIEASLGCPADHQWAHSERR